jgi:glucose/arabinose dehydrogenase/thiol-disulfide isomerase/thioredoxin
LIRATLLSALLPVALLADSKIQIPKGFQLSVFAQGMGGPRMMAIGPDKEIYVAEMNGGSIIRLPDLNRDGVADKVERIADGFRGPNSIAFHRDGSMYVAEPGKVWRLEKDGSGKWVNRKSIIAGLPEGGHSTRTLLFSRDYKWLFVAIGSFCNVCNEEDSRRATIMRYKADGSNGKIFAKGLRNVVGMTWRPGTDELWATCNGRDHLGDDAPPDTVQLVKEGDDFGWPRCHAGRITDPEFGSQVSCKGVAKPKAELQAHSAPLGLTFYTGDQFPSEYKNDLFVAFHGSWNRSKPTGYKVVRLSKSDGYSAPPQDFASGWLSPSGQRTGRPVDVLTAPDGALLISDDAFGKIHRISYPKPEAQTRSALKDITAAELNELVRSHKNSGVLVSLWATWCEPCVKELPELKKLVDRSNGKLKWILVSTDVRDEKKSVQKVLQKIGILTTTYFKNEPDSSFINGVHTKWSGALPANLLYSASGELIDFWEGEIPLDEISKRVSKVL